jgi:hypothetical protein
MRRVTLCLAFFALATAAFAQEMELNSAVHEMRTAIISAKKKTVAVIGFTNNQGYGPEFSLDLTEKLNAMLPPPSLQFKTLSRTNLDKIKGEQILWASSDFEASSAQKIGHLAGADAIIFGSYRVDDSYIKVSLQIVDTADGSILGGKPFSLPRNKPVDDILGPQNPRTKINEKIIEEAAIIGLNAIEHGKPDKEEDSRLIDNMNKATSMQILLLNGNNLFQNLYDPLINFKKRYGTHMQILLAQPDSSFYAEETDMVYSKKLTEDELNENKAKMREATMRLWDGGADDKKVEIHYYDTQYRLSMIILDGTSCYLTVRLSPKEPFDSFRLEFKGGKGTDGYAAQCAAHFQKLWDFSTPVTEKK